MRGLHSLDPRSRRRHDRVCGAVRGKGSATDASSSLVSAATSANSDEDVQAAYLN